MSYLVVRAVARQCRVPREQAFILYGIDLAVHHTPEFRQLVLAMMARRRR